MFLCIQILQFVRNKVISNFELDNVFGNSKGKNFIKKTLNLARFLI